MIDWTAVIHLIEALGPYAWPVVALIVAILFRRELRTVLSRVRKGKFLGQEIEFDPEVQELKKSVEAAARETATAEPPAPVEVEATKTPLGRSAEPADDDTTYLLKLASERPTVAIMQLAALLEREVRLLAASLGLDYRTRPGDIRSVINHLAGQGTLPPNTRSSLEIFWRLRTRIIHGLEETDEREALSVLDIGMTLLRVIRAVPHEVARVHAPDIELFADPDGRQRAEGVGVVLAVSSPGGIRVEHRVYPTNRAGYYMVGARVAWRWNLGRIWPRTWYREPESGELKLAWNSSGEFVGEMVDEPPTPTTAT